MPPTPLFLGEIMEKLEFALENEKYEITSDYSEETSYGIGPFEYNGERGFQGDTTYFDGSVIFDFDLSYEEVLEDAYTLDIDYYLMEKVKEEITGEEPEIDKFDVIDYQGKLRIVYNYVSF